MKYSIKLAVLGALLAAGVAQAATTTVTNFEQTFSFTLTATIQGPTTTNGAIVTTAVTTATVTTKDVIAALGKALTNTFSAKAQLLLITPTNTDNSPSIVVRDVVNKTNVDTTVPSGSLTHQTLSEVISSKVSNGKTTRTHYAISHIGFQPPGQSPSLFFDLTIFSTETSHTGVVSASGVGTGMVGTKEAVFKGTVSVSAYKAVKKVVAGQ